MLLEPPPVSEPLALSWYLSHGDSAVHGPFTFGTLLKSAQLGRIARTTLVFHPDFTGGKWVIALGLSEIAAAAINPVGPPPASESPSSPHRRTVHPDHTIDAPRDKARTKKRDWRSMLAQYRPDHPGKWLVLTATAIWAVGLPIVAGIAFVHAYDGMELQINGQYVHYIETAEAKIPTDIYSGGVVRAIARWTVYQYLTYWTMLYMVAGIIGIVAVFALRDSRTPATNG